MTKVKLSKKRREEIIKIYGHIPTAEEVFQKIVDSQERLASALRGAWETKPSDEETTNILLEIGERSGKLKKELEGSRKELSSKKGKLLTSLKNLR